MPREGAPQFYMFPWKYFFFTKWERSEEIKRELFYIRVHRFP
jgi:hypothetical protein